MAGIHPTCGDLTSITSPPCSQPIAIRFSPWVRYCLHSDWAPGLRL